VNGAGGEKSGGMAGRGGARTSMIPLRRATRLSFLSDMVWREREREGGEGVMARRSWRKTKKPPRTRETKKGGGVSGAGAGGQGGDQEFPY